MECRIWGAPPAYLLQNISGNFVSFFSIIKSLAPQNRYIYYSPNKCYDHNTSIFCRAIILHISF
jgi:hypothetical protein